MERRTVDSQAAKHAAERGGTDMASAVRRPLVLGIDAGGTMTDTFIVDEEGNFEVGKAATTPQDESVGFLESTQDAISYWEGMKLEELFPKLSVVLYSGTTMLNTLLSRRGQKVGLLVTNGFEDMLLMNRGLSWAGYGYADTLHAVTHIHPEPLTPKRWIHGITERIDMFGDQVIPLYEAEVQQAARELLTAGVDAVAICFLFSYLNPVHERRAKEIVESVSKEVGREVPVFLSSEIRPVMREQSRLNSLLIEAYAAAPVRQQLLKVQQRIHDYGFPNPLQTVLSYGGLSNIRYPRLHETLVSGPIGGILGAQDIARFKLNLPTIALESIGAGSGTIIKVDPATAKLELGPESAGADPGPVCFDRGGKLATVCDCAVVLGYLNPEYFLGGRIKLNVEAALGALREQVTDPIGVDVYQGAEGIMRLLELRARDALKTVASARGLNTSDYVLMAYGGSGPLHVAGYTEGLTFKGILTFPFAAAFSAFGWSIADYLHRYTKSMHLFLSPAASTAAKLEVGRAINAAWEEMERTALEEMRVEGREQGKVDFQHLAMIRYAAQLTDLEVQSSMSRIESPQDMDRLIEAWEALYEKINSRVSKYSEAGYQIFELGLLARIEKVKLRFQEQELSSQTPDSSAYKGTRSVFRDGQWQEAHLWEMGLLKAGNVIEGFAIIEHPATTFVIPPGRRVEIDNRNFLWLH